jgi:hypothetical protein
MAERSCRKVGSKFSLDHVIVVHVNRLTRDYLHYYHADRTHDGLNKDTPQGRTKSIRIPVSDWFQFLVLEVSTIAIPGQRLHERGEWIIGDVQVFFENAWKLVGWRANVGEDLCKDNHDGCPHSGGDVRVSAFNAELRQDTCGSE